MRYCFVFLVWLAAGLQKAGAQLPEGKYTAYELLRLRIDSSAKLYFYMMDDYPKEVWYHRLVVEIRQDTFRLYKSPVTVDKKGKMWYSASDGGFYTYRGRITAVGDVYWASARLVDQDYVGVLFVKDTAQANELYELITDDSGKSFYVQKGEGRKDFVIRPDKAGLWVNNVYFRKIGKKEEDE